MSDKGLSKATTTEAEKSRTQLAGDPVRQPTGSAPFADVLALQRTAGNGAVSGLMQTTRESTPSIPGAIPFVVQDVLRSPGQPLPPATREAMESGLGHNFGAVRVHTGAQADESAQAINARAYTVGQDIVFGAGQYSPETGAGQGLLAHELAHVVQQSRGGMPPTLHSSASHERDATTAASATMTGQTHVNVHSATGVGLARKNGEDEEIERALKAIGPTSKATPKGASKGNQIRTPMELYKDFVLSTRGFASSPSGAPQIDPKGIGGKQLGKGYETYGVVQLVDKDGKLVAVELGRYSGGGKKEKHAEREIIKSLKANLSKRQIARLRGGRMQAVIEKEPCPTCGPALDKLAKELKLAEYQVYTPTRAKARGKGKVKPKTAATTAAKGNVPELKLERVVHKKLATPKPKVAQKGQKTLGEQSAKTKVPSSKVGTKYAKNLGFTTPGRRSVLTYKTPKQWRRGPGPSIGKAPKVSPKGVGLAQVVPAAVNALHDVSVRHAVAVRMLHKWSTVEKWRKDHPSDWIVAVVSLQEWEIAVEGTVGRCVNYVHFFHGPTQEDVEAQASGVLHSGVPEGWREVGPFLGWIHPKDNLDELKELVEEEKKCFIATACYNSALAQEVLLLCAFRDAVLQRSRCGRTFIRVYYQVSPPVADFLQLHECLRAIVRETAIAPIIAGVRWSEKWWRQVSSSQEH